MKLPRNAAPTVGLGLVAFALGVGLWLDRHDVGSAERLARQNNLFSAFPSAELSELRLDRGSAEPLVLEAGASPGTYVIGSRSSAHRPADGALRRADPSAVDDLLRALEFATFGRRIAPSEVDLDAFGFRKPQLELNASFEHGSLRLLVGSPAPVPAQSHYASVRQIDGTEAVGTISDKLLAQLDVDPASLAPRLLLPFAKSELARVVESHGDTRVEWVADALGFRLGPNGTRLDRLTTDRLLFQMARLNPTELLDGDRAREAVASPGDRVRIEQVPRKGQAAIARLGGRCPSRDDLIVVERVTPDPLVGCFAPSIASELTMSAEQLVARTLSPLTSDEIDHLRIATSGRVLELLRKDAAFVLRGSAERDVPLDTGNALLTAFAEVVGTFVDHPPARPADGSVQVVGQAPLSFADEPSEARLELSFWRQGDSFVVERKDDGRTLSFDAADAWFLEADPSFARDRSLVTVPAAEIRGLDVKSSSGAGYSLSRQDGALSFEAPRGLGVDARTAENLLRQLSPLHVERFVTSDQPPLAVRTRIVVRGAEKAPARELSIGQRVRGGYLSSWSGEPSRFVLSPSVVRELEALPLDQSAFVLEPRDLMSLTLRTTEATLRFERRGEALVATSGEGRAELGRVVSEALLALRPLGAAHLGPARADEGLARPVLRISATIRSAGAPEERQLDFGTPAPFPGAAAVWARNSAQDASFFVDRAALDNLLDAL